ncbi:hypothetical protein [Rhodococcus sovatensis]|uniref:Secreted protein n=1 Tax=Rhodococcus sovatensis TaxID=1805840 RepID=A0ABZ2PGC9_9NOCA
METVLTLLLIRFAIIAALVTVVALALFGIAVHLKRRGRWDGTKQRIGPMAVRAADMYARRSQSSARGSWTTRAAKSAAKRLDEDRDRDCS